MRIIKGTYTDYLLLFGDVRTAYMDLAAKTATSPKGILYILLEDSFPFGFLAQVQDGDSSRIEYIFVMPEHRGKGAGRTLLEHAVGKSTAIMRLSALEQGESFAAIRHLVLSMGFLQENTSITYRSGQERNMSHWQKFMEEKGIYLNRILERMGFAAYSFREAPKELLYQLYHSGESDYANPLDVRPFFDIKEKCMDYDLSFLAVHRGNAGEELAAYNLVCRPDERSAVFGHMSEAAKYCQSGCVFLPISRSMQVFQEMGLNRAAYTMYEDNARAHALRRKIFAQVTCFSHRTYHYILRRPAR